MKGDALGLKRAVQVLAPGTQITRLVDRDEHSDEEIETLRSEGVRVLTRRSIESYLLDDEILERLCREEGHPEKAASVVSAKEAALLEAVGRGRPADDLKAVRRDVHDALKRELELTGRGSTTNEFLASTVAPLITADTAVYAQLRQDLFGALV